MPVPLFNRAALDTKPITAMYTSAKVDANRVTKTLISEIDNFPIEVNGIIVPIKVLVIEATQYQALVGNDWLFKTNVTLDWTTQELQIKAYQILWADSNHNKLLLILFWDNNNKGKQKKELN
ncbi:hypothetical protein G9A89_007286 [Geosiphon pyriformis]|nr:hypothetical protein G9A89_007286 [Geosiphon pyriformis]